MRLALQISLLLAVHLVSVNPALADPLLTPSFELQLETWLGQGDLDFTNVYTRAPGDDSLDFHAAADGQGPTFSLIEVIWNGNTYVIGGYNPQSWRTAPPGSTAEETFNLTPTDAERTAFIYNLTTGVLQRQRLTTDPDNVGSPFLAGDWDVFQTYNGAVGGPRFGGGFGFDIRADMDPNSPTGGGGQLIQNAYGVSWPACQFAYGGMHLLGGVSCDGSSLGDLSGVGAVEVYTFVPEPAMAAPLLLGAGMIAISEIRRSRARRRAHRPDWTSSAFSRITSGWNENTSRSSGSTPIRTQWI